MSRIRTKLQRDQARAELEATIATALQESVGTQRVIVTPTGADAQRLRGIPAIGRGVAGHITGTHPERDTIARIKDTEKSPRAAQTAEGKATTEETRDATQG